MAATPSIESAEPEPQVVERAAARWATWELIAVVAATVLALTLRAYHMTGAPLFTDNLDEIQFTWAGLGLIQHGDPYTWSFFPGYPAYTAVTAFGVTVPVVHHWMDHPPLFSLLIGGWVWLLGVRDMTGFDAVQVRVVPVVLSTLTIPMVHALARQLVGSRAAICAAGLLATAPGAVLLGRQAEPESLQAVLLLAALLLSLRIVDGRWGAWTVAGLLACALAAPLAKISGIAVAGICMVILAATGRWRLAGLVAAAGVGSLLLFVLYGAIIDWRLFVHIFSSQVGNRIGVMAGFDFIEAAAGVNRRLRDGWWLLGWVGLGLLLARRGARRELFLVWPAVAYAATMLVLAGERQVEAYGWYRIIIYPELYLAAGFLAWEAVTRRSLALLTLLIVLGGATATNWWLGGPDAAWVPNPVDLVVLIVAIIGPAVLLMWRREEPRYQTIAAWAAGAALALIVLGNTVESLQLDHFFARM